ncbi:MAG: tetratricopeptide repeat protein, partial [Phycisphaerales bacterium]|nr:tetratricopeptide repeat protein [Phycisphaerales bacterium]
MSQPGDIKSTAADVLTEMVKKVSVEGMIAGVGVLGTICTGGALPVVTSVAGIVAAMALFGALKLKKAAKDRAKDEEQARHCERVGQLLEQLKQDQSAARDQLAEIALQQSWFKDAIARGPATFNAAFEREFSACKRELTGQLTEVKDRLTELKADTTQIQSTLAELTHLEFDTNWRVREVALVLQDHGQKLDANTDLLLDQGKKLDTNTDLLNQILSHLKHHPSREEIEREIRPRLEQEIEAKLRREQSSPGVEDLQAQAKRLADIAITALNTKGFAERAAEVGGAAAVLEGLQKQAAAHESAARHHIDASIEIWRKIAEWAYLVGEIDTAAESLRKILALRPNDLGATNRLGHVMKLRGNLDEAKRLYTRVGELASDDARRAVSLGNLGLIEQTRGNLDAAAEYHKKSLAIEEKLGHPEGMAAQYGNLGNVERTRGNLDAAEEYLKKSLAIDEKLGRQEGMANQYGNLGLIEKTRGNLDAAEQYHKRALAIDEKLGRQEGMANQYGNLGVIEQTRGNLDAAEEYLKKSLAIDEKLGRQEGMAATYGNLGVIERARGNLDAAEEYLKKSLTINEKLGLQEGMAI